MARRKRQRDSNTLDEVDAPHRPRRNKRLRRRFVLLLLLLVGLIAAAPAVISRTSLRDALLAKAVPPGWQIESEQGTLGWMGDQKLTGVTIVDSAGKPLLKIDSVRLSRSLMSLVLDQSQLGKVEFVRPVAYLESRPNGSNWEDFVAAIQQQIGEQPAEESVARARQVVVEITSGKLHGVDAATGRQWLLDQINTTAVVGEKLEVQGSAQLTNQEPSGQGQVKFHWQPIDSGQQLKLLAERLPLGPLEPWLARLLPEAQLSGRLSTDSTFVCNVENESRPILQTSGRMELSDLVFATAHLRGDRLQSSRCVARWDAMGSDNFLIFHDSEIETDWGKLTGGCTLQFDEQGNVKPQYVQTHDNEVRGSFDLAKLAAMLPRTLQLRQGVKIDTGSCSLLLAGEMQGERLTWKVGTAIEGLAGSEGGRNIRWQEPVSVWAELTGVPDGELRLERLGLVSSFAKANVHTDPKAIRGDIEINLEKLAQDFGQFVDMQTWQLRGLGEGTFRLARQPNQQFEAEANLNLTALEVAERGRKVWGEPKLKIGLQATGAQQELRPTSFTSGKLDVHGSQDALTVELLGPVDLQNSHPLWDLQVEGNGPLASWAERLRPWLDSMPRRLEGDAHLRAKVQLSDELLQTTEVVGSVVQLRVESDGLSVDEPRVEFSGDALWDAKSKRLLTQQMQLLGSSFSFRARDIAVALAAAGAPTAKGSVAFSADLERLAAMLGWVGQSAATWPQGTAIGQLQLASDAEQLQADFGIKVEQLKLVSTSAGTEAVYGRPETVWTEPQLELTGVAKYSTVADRAQFEDLQVRGKTLRLKSSVSVDQVQSAGQLQASGLLEYDSDELAKLVASYSGQEVQLQGDQQVRFQVAGSLFDTTNKHWSQRWNMRAEAGWSSAGAFGLPLGSGRLVGNLRNGDLQIAPLDLAVGQGRLTAQPQVFFVPLQQLVLPKGPLVTQVAISPEVSETMLKYVAPILAGATRAEGQFSVDLDHAQIPLRHPKTGRLQGHLGVHRLSVSPGPMVAQLATLIRQIEALSKREQFLQAATSSRNKAFLTVSERQIDFQVVEGRVYHRNLEFMIDGVPVRSYGSVGFDQTLALMIEVPFQDKWIEREPALRGFAGKSLQLPIRGTFQKPRIDQRAVANLSSQLLQGAATQAIGDELNRQFEKLLGR